MAEALERYYIREVGRDELPQALYFRQQLYREMGVPSETLIPDSGETLRRLYEREFDAARLRHYFAYARDGDVPVAVTGALLKEDFPYFLFLPGRYGWILDVYTLPEHRGQGLAKALLARTHEWLLSVGVHEAKLIASGKDARRLYERSGYRPTWEMALNLSGDATFNSLIDER